MNLNQFKWHAGSPLHIGWWSASMSKNKLLWRWWDGKEWSWFAEDTCCAEDARHSSMTKVSCRSRIFWRHYYPKDARVPRIDPRVETKGKHK